MRSDSRRLHAPTGDETAQPAGFFSFGMNDLTQTTIGTSRDDSGGFPWQRAADFDFVGADETPHSRPIYTPHDRDASIGSQSARALAP